MNRSNSIQALVSKSKKDFVSLKADYDAALQHQTISEELKIDIKNIFENLRSCLDYMAHDIFEACMTGNTPRRLYFPIRQSRIVTGQPQIWDRQKSNNLLLFKGR